MIVKSVHGPYLHVSKHRKPRMINDYTLEEKNIAREIALARERKKDAYARWHFYDMRENIMRSKLEKVLSRRFDPERIEGRRK